MQQITSNKLNFLICTLYTLASEDKNFKSLNLKYAICLDKKNNVSFYKTIQNFRNSINNVSIRRFAFILVTPILTKNSSSSLLTSKDQDFINQTKLLKKYLKKFRHNYNRYFFFKSEYYDRLPLNKEINSQAIEYLFLLAGI